MNIDKALRTAHEYFQAGNFHQAEHVYKNIVEKKPNHIKALYLLGITCLQIGDYHAAITYLNKVLHLDPRNAEVYYHLGVAFQDIGHHDEAIAHYRKALRINPTYTIACYNLGVALQNTGHHDEAIQQYQKVLELNPSFAEAWNNLGTALKDKGRLDEAVICYQKALELNPEISGVYNNLGVVSQYNGQLDEALAYYQQALDLNPDLFDIYNNLGLVWRDKGELDKAATCFRKSLQINPGYADAHWNMSYAFLLAGNFKEGWKEYEWRLKTHDFASVQRTFTQPVWDGSSLKGKTLLIFAEQGVGDEIMFASCYPDVIDQANVCIMECDKRLIPIFSRSFPRSDFVERVKETDAYSSQLPQTDMVIPHGSLPSFLRTDIASFPRRKFYLIPDEEKVQSWHNRLKKLGEGLNAGISWRGGGTPRVIRNRSIMLEQGATLFSLSGVHFINLQYGDCVNELREAREKLGVTIHDWEDADPLKDIDNFAAQISALDLVISVDNATVHLAGALGKPVWTLLPFVPDWRWLLNREDSPWYPTMRLFRQPSPGDWESVIAKVSAELQKIIQKKA